jgi:hypothetical protein
MAQSFPQERIAVARVPLELLPRQDEDIDWAGQGPQRLQHLGHAIAGLAVHARVDDDEQIRV